jgi:hypothetical protein
MKTPFKGTGALLTLLLKELQPIISATRKNPETDKTKQRAKILDFLIMPTPLPNLYFVF